MISIDGSDPIIRQDLEDLHERWSRATGDLERSGSAIDAKRAREAFDALDEYVHAGQVPDANGPDDVLVRISRRSNE